MSESYLVIELNQQPVELCKLLKIANLVSGGGEAKIVISEGYVLLNGEVEYQKRKKIYHQDVIEFNGEVVQLIINETLAEAEDISEATLEQVVEVADKKLPQKKTRSQDKPGKSKSAKKKQASKKSAPAQVAVDNGQEIMPKKRRPISF
ncbi:MAG: RNA-binding S4 domain-containing protein [Colwellia sp.]|uniref:RNA-binding S4 domain-containing protein n=1 Tax=Colwellia sp. TaxID=56799 RepID=UPI001D7458D8|nr:RNA-binding S4 domain-containing protein [Colwellia sp.]NQY49397.1 RNA-binding S4 domain-containing protein [Colwellia sp.]